MTKVIPMQVSASPVGERGTMLTILDTERRVWIGYSYNTNPNVAWQQVALPDVPEGANY